MLKIKKFDLLILIFLFILALCFRLPQSIDGLLTQDSADYAIAAQKGFWSNYWDVGTAPFVNFLKGSVKDLLLKGDVDTWKRMQQNEDIVSYRHFHPPLFIYFICFLTFLFGKSYIVFWWAAECWNVVTVCILFLGSKWLFEKRGRFIGFVSGFLLSVTPILGASGNLSPHPLGIFLIIITLFLFVKFLKTDNLKYMYFLSISLSFTFLTTVFALILLFVIALSIVIFKNTLFAYVRSESPSFLKKFTEGKVILSAHLFFIFLLGFFNMAIFWPAGFIKLTLLKNFSMFMYVSLFEREAYYGTFSTSRLYSKLFQQNVFLMLLIIFSIIYVLYLFAKKQMPAYLLAFLFYLALAFLTVLRTAFCYPLYSIYLLPIIFMLCAIFLQKVYERKRKFAGIIVTLILIAILITNVNNIFKIKREGVPYLKETIDFMKREIDEGSRILTNKFRDVFEYYLPGAKILGLVQEEDDIKETEEDFKRKKFEYIIFITGVGTEKGEINDYTFYPYVKTDFSQINVIRGEKKEKVVIYKRKQ